MVSHILYQVIPKAKAQEDYSAGAVVVRVAQIHLSREGPAAEVASCFQSVSFVNLVVAVN